jgi:Protein of unknown function (DUF3298)
MGTGMKKTLIAMTAAAVIGGATGCGTSIGRHQITPHAASTQPSVATQGQSLCAELNGTVGSDQLCHVRSVTPTSKIDMSVPLDYPVRTVVDFLKHNRDEFLDWIPTYDPTGKRGRPYQYIVTATTYRSGKPDSGTQSLVLEIDNDTGWAHEGHPDTAFHTFNFDLGKHGPITFDTLFKPGTEPLEALNPIVQNKFHTSSADLTAKTYRAFAITDDAVIFFFGQNQVIPDNNGPHKITVPRTDLAPLLA